ncbi:MAG: alpha/beta fold hydrolase, partial [Vicinamibacteria bacterium]|nr:alpha/beta fold hydrolase [Vicinamibacteria bacterium]
MSAALGIIRNAQGERLDVTCQAAGGTHIHSGVPRAVVVIAHGVTAHKDRPLLTALADALSEAGLASLRVSFAGNGSSEGRFEDSVPTKEVGDLGSVIDALVAGGVEKIAFAGHSMGGAVGVMRAADDPRITCLVSLAGMVHVDAFMRAQFGHLTPGMPMLDKPECPWSSNLADDAARIGSVTAQAARISVPWLLVHGGADELVP